MYDIKISVIEYITYEVCTCILQGRFDSQHTLVFIYKQRSPKHF